MFDGMAMTNELATNGDHVTVVGAGSLKAHQRTWGVTRKRSPSQKKSITEYVSILL
jgi:hypothetical protein